MGENHPKRKKDSLNPYTLSVENGKKYVLFSDSNGKKQKIEITDRFDADGYCYLELRDGDDTLYATIDKNGGMATSPTDYPQPDEFGTS